MEIALIISAYFLASIIGAAPLGLVNLTVLNVSYRKGLSSAMQIAVGASVIEILFVLMVVLPGGIVTHMLQANNWIQWLFVIIPVLTGVYFILKKNDLMPKKENDKPAFIRGAVLNLISIQVLLYWIFAAAYIEQHQLLVANTFLIFIALTTVGFGKMIVLWLYARLSKLVLNKFQFLARRINWLIGIILIIAGLVQYLKM
jgi:threonine/homoserine/homoserine lactone efflux protein